ncbi:hypothetical protein PI125_g3758 [Phytophthora idaei]|nr:hypothetical protein PI125_g3758 [Phytophthora idaei]KAG3167939.1 hypothetical protein PI126_g3553 [Phytophthora idaei]
MRSDPGGEAQEPHKDYQHPDLERDQAVHPGGVPGSMIFALQTATKMRIYTGCFDARDESKATVASVPISFCVLFRGDIIHNGVPYRKTNYRIHCCLSYEGVEWTPDVVQNTLPEHSTCKYCGEKMEKGPPFLKHQFFCNDNPRGPANRLKREAEGKDGVHQCDLCPDKSYPCSSSSRVHKMRTHRVA